MPDLKRELALCISELRASSKAARQLLGLYPDEFAWFKAEIRYPMEPQPIVPESSLVHDSYLSDITYFGGVMAKKGQFSYGHIQAEIAEHLKDGAMHQTGPFTLPRPWIQRELNMLDGTVTVDTPSKTCAPLDGPMIIEGVGGHERYRQATAYHLASGIVVVRSGKRLTGRHPRITEENISQLPPEIVANRLEIMVRTVKSATDIFQRIGNDISAYIQREAPVYA
ncbi:MAG TPA: hypothetical protein VFT59_04305 [Candidatus Saccharimonadales bacterium]|nr:hypothetical protein [Candidatus Saccharimonadales bacterium]